MGTSIREIVEKLSKEKLVGYFLILWGASFFFNAISGLAYYATFTGNYFSAQMAFGLLSDLTSLAITALLVMTGLKILQIKIS
jgi:hypothetical protein